jgi:hypothetical protein
MYIYIYIYMEIKSGWIWFEACGQVDSVSCSWQTSHMFYVIWTPTLLLPFFRTLTRSLFIAFWNLLNKRKQGTSIHAYPLFFICPHSHSHGPAEIEGQPAWDLLLFTFLDYVVFFIFFFLNWITLYYLWENAKNPPLIPHLSTSFA